MNFKHSLAAAALAVFTHSTQAVTVDPDNFCKIYAAKIGLEYETRIYGFNPSKYAPWPELPASLPALMVLIWVDDRGEFDRKYPGLGNLYEMTIRLAYKEHVGKDVAKSYLYLVCKGWAANY